MVWLEGHAAAESLDGTREEQLHRQLWNRSSHLHPTPLAWMDKENNHVHLCGVCRRSLRADGV